MNEVEKDDLRKILKTEERELEAVLKAKRPFLEIEQLRKESKEIAKVLNEAYALVDDKIVPQFSQEDIRRTRAYMTYREQKGFDEDMSDLLSGSKSLTPIPALSDTQFRLPALQFGEDVLGLNITGPTTSTPAVIKSTTGIREKLDGVNLPETIAPAFGVQDIKVEISETKNGDQDNLTTVDLTTELDKFDQFNLEDQAYEIKEGISKQIDVDTLAKYFSERGEIMNRVKGNVIRYFGPK